MDTIVIILGWTHTYQFFFTCWWCMTTILKKVSNLGHTQLLLRETLQHTPVCSVRLPSANTHRMRCWPALQTETYFFQLPYYLIKLLDKGLQFSNCFTFAFFHLLYLLCYLRNLRKFPFYMRCRKKYRYSMKSGSTMYGLSGTLESLGIILHISLPL